MPNYLFKAVDEYQKSYESDQLETNLVAFLQWGFLNIGAFEDAERDTELPYGGASPAQLRLIKDNRYTLGKVWESNRSQWVWQNTIPYSRQPISASGVWVNNTFYPTATTTGTYRHTIDFPLGRVLFNSAIPTGSLVECEHSYQYVQVRSADEPWFQKLSFNTFRTDEAQYTQPIGTGGDADILSQNKVQLPAIVVESVGNAVAYGREQGNCSRVQRLDVNLYVLAETPTDRKRCHDILVAQFDRYIPTFDKNEVVLPLGVNGAPVSGAKTYPQLVEQAPWSPVRIVKTASGGLDQFGKNLFWITVRGTFEFDAD